MLQKNKRRKQSSTLLYIIAAVAIVASAVISYVTIDRMLTVTGVVSNILFYVFELSICCAYIIDVLHKTRYSKKTAYQLAFIYLCFDVFLVSALKYPDNNRSNVVMILSGILFLAFGTWFWMNQIISNDYKPFHRKRLKKESLIGLSMLLVVATIIGIDNFRIMPIWDNNIYLKDYFSQLPSWDFSFGQFLSVKYCGHASQAVTPFVMISRWLGRDYAYYVLRAIILFSGLAMTLAIYSIVGHLCTTKPVQRTIIALAVIVFPSVLPMQMISLDDFSLLFLVLWLCSFYNEFVIFEFIFAILFLFSKEPNIVLFLGILLGIILSKKTKNRFLPMCVSAALWFLLYVGPGIVERILNLQQGGQINSNNGIIDMILSFGWKPTSNQNTFAFNPSFFLSVASQIVTFNFIWLVLLLGFISFCLLIVIDKKNVWPMMTSLFPLICGVIFESVFLCVYITYKMYRYRFIINILILLVCYTLICRCISALFKGKYIIPAFSVLALLFLIESYYMIDSLTLKIGRRYSTGNGLSVSGSNGKLYVSDEMVTNHQGMEYVSFMQSILQTVDYSSDDVIVLPKMLESDGTRNHFGIYGYWIKRNYYNEKEQKIYLLEIGDDYGEPINRLSLLEDGTIVAIDEEADLEKEYEHWYVIDFPFMDAFDISSVVENNYEVLNTYEVSYRSWKCNVFQIR